MEIDTYQFTGEKEGPHLLITAGVHGDEFLPMLAVKTLVEEFELQKRFHGTLTLIPIVNESAFDRGHRCGEDGLDLARSCPGRSDGSITEQIAFQLSQKIHEADFYIDLHTGGTELSVLPLAGYVLHLDKAILEKQREMAHAFQLPLAWGSSAKLQGRSLSVARDAGVPAIYVEYLGAHRELSEVATGAMNVDHPLVSGCLNVMRLLGMLDESVKTGIEPETIEDRRSDSGHMQVCHPAPVTGFFQPKVKLGQIVKKGDSLGEVTPNICGPTKEIISEESGKVVVLRDYPRIRQGEASAVVTSNYRES